MEKTPLGDGFTHLQQSLYRLGKTFLQRTKIIYKSEKSRKKFVTARHYKHRTRESVAVPEILSVKIKSNSPCGEFQRFQRFFENSLLEKHNIKKAI